MAATKNEAADNGAAARWQTAWTICAAFGTYFCMYAFRKPFTADAYTQYPSLLGIDFKSALVMSQVAGYMVSKFVGIKVVAEMPPQRRAKAILFLIGCAELALLLFALTPPPWSAVWLFFNGLPLGMVFGLVLGFLEGRKQTEFLAAGLCSSFILADGVTKSLGAELIGQGVPTAWMPFVAGVAAIVPLSIFVWMLTRIAPPSADDVAARSARVIMERAERYQLYARYWSGLTVIVGVYLLITILRSMRADFAPELWKGLGANAAPSVFSYSEILVALGVLVVSGATVLIRDNRRAFLTALGICGFGFVMILATLWMWNQQMLSPFAFMVLMGVGLYLPYVAVHTTVFERLLAMTRERGNIGYLMYVADAFGYLGYVAIMLGKQWLPKGTNVLHYFVLIALGAAVISFAGIVYAWRYFARTRSATQTQETLQPAVESVIP